MLLSSPKITLSDFYSLSVFFELDCFEEATERIVETLNFEVLCYALPKLFVESLVER